MSWLLGIIKIIFLLGTLVTIHELGHFIVAKACKVKVHKFAIGFGPKLLTKVKGETEYTIRAIPFGGFVQLEGEDEHSEDEKAFNKKPVWQRMLIIIAGATVNILFALLVYGGICMISNVYTSTITGVDINTEAYAAGLREGDTIVAINGKLVRTAKHVENMITRSKTDEMVFEIERDGQKVEIPMVISKQDIGRIGVNFSNNGEIYEVEKGGSAELAGLMAGDKIISVNGQEGLEVSRYSDMIKDMPNKEIAIVLERKGQIYHYTVIPQTVAVRILEVSYQQTSQLDFWKKSYYAMKETGYYFNETIKAFATLLTGKNENVEMMGPVGIAGKITQTQEWIDFFYMMAAISLSLGIFNLLPVPGLDGGKFLFLIIEAIRRKPMQEKTEMSWQLAGFALI